LARRKATGKTPNRTKRPAGRGRAPKRPRPKSKGPDRTGPRDLALLLVCATALVYFTPHTYRAVRDLLAMPSMTRLESSEDLSAEGVGAGRGATVTGVPDYDHRVRDTEGREYFRVAEFPEGLLVRAPRMDTPESVEDILAPRAFSGITKRLGDLAEGDVVADKFRAQHRLRVEPTAVVLLVGEQGAFPYVTTILNALALLGVVVILERRFGL